MPIDLGRVAQTALKAALDNKGSPSKVAQTALKSALDNGDSGSKDSPSSPDAKKPFLSTGQGMLLGAGAVTVARLLTGSRAREMFGSLEDRLQGTVGLDVGQETEEQNDEPELEEEPEA